jgi:hypothetical protein
MSSLSMNVGSAGDKGAPWISTYVGCEPFLKAWTTSISLAHEMKAERRDVEVIGVTLIETLKASYRKKLDPTLDKPDSKTIARAAREQDWLLRAIMLTLNSLPEAVFAPFLINEMAKEARSYIKIT